MNYPMLPEKQNLFLAELKEELQDTIEGYKELVKMQRQEIYDLKKYKAMLDEGLITEEQYQAKSNELLGL